MIYTYPANKIETQPVPLLDLKAQYAAIREDIQAAIDRVVESQYFILGPEVTEAMQRSVVNAIVDFYKNS